MIVHLIVEEIFQKALLFHCLGLLLGNELALFSPVCFMVFWLVGGFLKIMLLTPLAHLKHRILALHGKLSLFRVLETLTISSEISHSYILAIFRCCSILNTDFTDNY